MNKIYFFMMVTLILLKSQIVSAGWEGPIDVKSFEWGNKTGQIGFESSDTEDMFPSIIYVSQDGNILLPDGLNKRIYILKPTGTVINCLGVDKIKTKNNLMPFIIGGIGGKILLKLKDDYMVYDYSGNLIKSFIGVSAIDLFSIYIVEKRLFILGKADQRYYEYNIDGQLIKTYDTRPLELGVIKEESLGGGKYKTTIQYNNKTYITERLAYHNYFRGCYTTLYATLYKEIVKYDANSKLMAELVMPETEYKILRPGGGGFNEKKELVVEYGDPILAPNGDVYTWKRTPDKYSIIKWVWVDGPECPQYLEAMPIKSSLKFTWQKPTKDADKVTGYQLLQSYNICGPFRQVVELKKDIFSYEDKDVKKGETYYYIVKAIRGKDYSGNSNKVCGQIE